MELAAKWMYAVDKQLVKPYRDDLSVLLNTAEFVDLVDDQNLLRRLDFLRRSGNTAAHSAKKISRDQARLALENLFYFLDFIACCYDPDYQPHDYDPTLLPELEEAVIVDRKALDELTSQPPRFFEAAPELSSQLTRRQQAQQPAYVPKPLDLTEYETRKLYIDAMLQDAGWTEGADWLNEYPVEGMPNSSGKGFVDYVLLGDDGRPLALVEAKRAFVNLLPELSITNLCENRENLTARAVFSTYQTMMGCIDDARDEEGGKLFTVGHFDLIIVDEAHRSIYKKYQAIFDYFDAHLVGLTATPKAEIDKNTYGIFDLREGDPTYGYELSQAVEDGYLVDFRCLETTLKFTSGGIEYEQLSEEDKEQYEDTFTDEDGVLPDRIESSALNEWVFNEDTIRKVLDTLMTQGIRVDYGNKLGKLQGEQAEELTAFRRGLIEDMAAQAAALDRGSFAVRLHLREVERFSKPDAYAGLTYENTLQLEELAPLLPPAAEEASAVQFDALLYSVELACLVGQSYTKAR